jgi:hypothetical protein
VPKKAETTGEPVAKKSPVRRRTKAKPVELHWDTVATRAYFIHLEAGGDPIENWLRAERELIAA